MSINRFALAIIAYSSAVDARGSLSECLSEEDAEVSDISTVNWPASYELTLDAGDSCYHVTFSQSYAWWESSQ